MAEGNKGCGCFLIILILLGFIVSVYLVGQGSFSGIVHP